MHKNFDVPLTDGLVVRIARVYMTPKDVREKTGIYANFSMKIVRTGVATKKGAAPQDIDICAINSLTLSSSKKDGRPYIGSLRGDNGKGGYIYAFQPFPGSAEDDDQNDRLESFLEKLTAKLQEAYEYMQNSYMERQAAPVPAPAMFAKLPARERRQDSQQPDTSNVPF